MSEFYFHCYYFAEKPRFFTVTFRPQHTVFDLVTKVREMFESAYRLQFKGSPMTRSSFLRHAFLSRVINQLTHRRQSFQKNPERTSIRALSSGAISRMRTPISKTTSCFHHSFLAGLLDSTSCILSFLTWGVCCFKSFHYIFLIYVSL